MILKLEEMNITDEQKQSFIRELQRRETENLRQFRNRLSPDSFIKLTSLGHGGYGQVFLVKQKNTGKLYAMKVLSKALMLERKQSRYVYLERDLMASNFSNWIVKLEATF